MAAAEAPPSSPPASPTPARKQKTRRERPALAADAAAAFVRSRWQRGKVHLKGNALLDADAVKAACDAVLALSREGATERGGGGGGGGGGGDDDDAADGGGEATTTLNLASANICAAGAAHVAALLSDPACRLRELSLADNPRVGDAGATATIRAIASTPRSTLARLNLSGCGVTDVTARALADALTGGEGGEGEGGIGTTRCCASLRCVNLRSNGITTAGCDALTRAATATSARDDGRASSLIEAPVGNNPDVSRDAADALRDALAKNRGAALVMEIRSASAANGGRCTLRRRGLDDNDARALAAFLAAENENGDADAALVGLDVSENAITRYGFIALAEAMKTNDTLRSVNVAGNVDADGDAARTFAGRVAVNHLVSSEARGGGGGEKKDALKSVSDRGLGDAGAIEVANLLAIPCATTRAMTHLGVHHNGIGDLGAVALAEAFARGGAPLEEIAAYSNAIGPKGAAAIAKRLPSTTKALDLGGNALGDDGCVAIARVVRTHPNLVELHVDHNGVGEAGAKALLDAMKSRESDDDAPGPAGGIQRLWLHGNDGISDETLREAYAVAARNAAAADEGVCEVVERENARTLREKEDAAANAAAATTTAAGSTTFADRVAALANATYRARCPTHAANARGVPVIAAILAREAISSDPDRGGGDDSLKVVSLGVGTKFLPPAVAAAAHAAGNDRWRSVVHDSHAEVLARRALMRLLYREIEDLVAGAADDDADGFKLLERVDAPALGFRLRPSTSLHLYVSTAPCGAASMPGGGGVAGGASFGRDVDDLESWTPVDSPAWKDAAARRHVVFAPSVVCGAMIKGAARVGDPPAPAPGCVWAPGGLAAACGTPGRALSCSDKIARWQAVGLQGALLSHFVPAPMAFSTIVVGRKFDPTRLRLGTCCRSIGWTERPSAWPVPTHARALGVSARGRGRGESIGAAKHGDAIGDKSRADAGDGDESLSWARGDARVARHDGRTGGPIGGLGAHPAVCGEALFESFARVLAREGIGNFVDDAFARRRDGDGDGAAGMSYEEAKYAATAYNDAKRSLRAGGEEGDTPVNRWRGRVEG